MHLKRFPIWLLVVIGMLVVLRLILPMAGYYGINWALAHKLGHYTGQINDFDLALYRGAYQLQGLEIRKKEASNKDVKALVHVREIDLSISWKALFEGTLAADIGLYEPTIALADSGNAKKSQLGTDEPIGNWRHFLKVIFPIKIESFVVENGSLSFVNRDLKKPIPVKIDKFDFIIRRLYTHASKKMSPFRASARLQKQATVHVNGRINILSRIPEGGVNFKLENFQLASINPVLRVYIPLDITHSLLSVYGEAATKKGDVDGYVKVFLKDNDIIARDQKFLSLKHVAFEFVSGLASWILENTKKDDVAMIVPFHRKNGKWDVDSSKAFWSALENKVDALKPKINGSIEP